MTFLFIYSLLFVFPIAAHAASLTDVKDTLQTSLFSSSTFKSKPQHVFTFNTASAIPDGFFRILIPAAKENNNDTIPDSTGFDFNTTVDTSFQNAPNYIFTTRYTTPSGSGNCPPIWHCFDFYYVGTGQTGTSITLTIGNTDGTNTPIAPLPKTTHEKGNADVYSFKVQNFTSGANPLTDVPTDQTLGKIGINEAVRVSAIVLGPSITPPPELIATITPAPLVPTPSVTPTPSPIVTTPTSPFYRLLLVLLIFGLPLHLLMAIIGTRTPLRFVLYFIFILAFPFLRRKKYRTVPFCFIDIFKPDNLNKPWQSTLSDINGDYDLRNNIPENIFVHLACAHRTWNNVIIKSSLLSIGCLYPNLTLPPTKYGQLTKHIFKARVVPLTFAILTSGLAFFLAPSYFVLIYLYFSLQFTFSEYLYPRINKN